MTITRFYGDGEYPFHFKTKLVPELERLTGAGFGSIYGRIVRHEFEMGDVVETIRLGLIGGDMAPEKAAALTEVYFGSRPFEQDWLLAIEILSAFYSGPDDQGTKSESTVDSPRSAAAATGDLAAALIGEAV